MSTLANILEIQRMSTEDGPGIRTTVFFKGCSLACSWCHNPESIENKRAIIWHDYRCIGCRTCVEVCPESAVTLSAAAGVVVDKERCVDCGTCVDECPSTALERQGAMLTVDQIMAEVVRDIEYYDPSGGGVTLSGGEPVLQVPVVRALLQQCRKLGIHTALDTCGMCGIGALRELAAGADLVLYDLKELDNERHRAFTGKGSTKIVENFRKLVASLRESDAPATLWVRTPLIPGATATDENLLAIGKLLAAEAADLVERWDLCAFNNLCQEQYARLGQTWEFAGQELLTAAELSHFAGLARRCGLPEGVVRVSGPTRLERAERGDDEPDARKGAAACGAPA